MYYWIDLAGLAMILLVNLFVKDPAGTPVSPISTIQMIWIYVIMSPPAATLSVQKASPTVMLEPPRPPTESLFNSEIILDTLVYSISLAGFTLSVFYIVLFGAGNGVQAVNCDSDFTEGCYDLYRARSALLVLYSYFSLVLAVHCRSYRRSEWNVRGIKETIHTHAWVGTLIFDTIGLLIFIYVPTVNVQGFRQAPISWEWGLCIGFILLWIAFGEVYKMIKRKFMKPIHGALHSTV